MLKFRHTERELINAFNLGEGDLRLIDEVIAAVSIGNVIHMPITRMIERIWVDERLSDNAKAYMIFQTGRIVQQQGEKPW